MERVRLSLDELAEAGEAERCLACDAPARSSDDPVLAPGVDLGALDEHLPSWTVCDDCVRDRVANERRARRTQIALATTPSLGLAIAVLVPFAHPSAPMLGAAIGAVITFFAMRVAVRRLGRGVPLLLVSAHESQVEILRRGPRAPRTDPAGPYRSAAPPAAGREASAAIGGGGWAWLIGTALAGLAAFLSTAALYPRVRLDNARYARAHIEIDGERAVHVGSGDSLEISLRHGAHRLTIQYPRRADRRGRGRRAPARIAAPLRGGRGAMLPPLGQLADSPAPLGDRRAGLDEHLDGARPVARAHAWRRGHASELRRRALVGTALSNEAPPLEVSGGASDREAERQFRDREPILPGAPSGAAVADWTPGMGSARWSRSARKANRAQSKLRSETVNQSAAGAPSGAVRDRRTPGMGSPDWTEEPRSSARAREGARQPTERAREARAKQLSTGTSRA